VAWARIDDRANGNAKLIALSDAAWRMWGCGLIFAQANLTDGFIASGAIATFGVKARDRRKVINELCRSLVKGKAPLWHRVDGGYQIHDYLQWNESREAILRERERAKSRADRFRRRFNDQAGVTNGARHGDQLPFDQGGDQALRTPHVNRTTPTTTPTEVEDQDHLFDRFWGAYPKHRRVVKQRAHRAWLKLRPTSDLVDRMLDALAWQSRTEQWTKDGGRYVPHPSTWLNDHRWEDECGGPPRTVESWIEECQRIHSGACKDSPSHYWQKDRDAEGMSS
jgi:hypothetical protein